MQARLHDRAVLRDGERVKQRTGDSSEAARAKRRRLAVEHAVDDLERGGQIGRASCRERVS